MSFLNIEGLEDLKRLWENIGSGVQVLGTVDGTDILDQPRSH